ncbi:PPC domain-containing DNA-binding protein [Coleofasciculus sp. FACHB-SPT36]|uniref:PPC domain-containing DNA-binding protein n=1 Tax=Coleofasciculus sp. FACHB-SPT36 TaxID=2692790 RepID=UPI00168B8AC1|nr:PPC domain-containing DNA-binding protein [Coleofasciculus sp. FACHB-SPT36]MBD2539122.1 DNA-binding protein [Coleofasciculus sp. FACHB-SPT36]
MKVFAIRLKPDQDLKKSLQDFAIKQNLQSGFILTGVGSLKKATLRFANHRYSTAFNDNFEIISLNGTLEAAGIHLNIAIANKEGKTIGGHLMEGCIIYTTAEIVIGVSEEFTFLRTMDEQTGYKELEIFPNPNY